MATLDTFDAYLEYHAIRLHFIAKSYDYFKYRGKTKKSWDTFLKDNSKKTFTPLAKKYNDDYVSFVATAFALTDEVKWVGDLLYDDKYHEVWLQHEKYMQSSRFFKDELNGIIQVMDDNAISLKQALINTSVSDVPIIEKLRIQGLISIETMIILDTIFHFSRDVDSSNPRWIKTKKIIDSYKPFMKMNLDKYKDIVKGSSLLDRVVA